MRQPHPQRSHPYSPLVLEPLEARSLLSAAPITFVDGDGTAVKITLTGNGAMDYNADDNVLNVAGTDQGSKLKITAGGGDGRFLLGSIEVIGAIKSIIGKATDLVSHVSISGSIKTLTLGDLPEGSPHAITIGGTSAATASTITLGQVVDLTIQSGAPIKLLKVMDWDDTAADDLISAPELASVESKGDLATGVRLEDPDSGNASLGKAKAAGALSGTWLVDGNAGSLTAGSVTPEFRMNILGNLASFRAKGDFLGLIAAVNIDKVVIDGDLTGATLLGGADLGDDATLGGGDDDADLFFRGTIGSMTVKGQVAGSIVGAGLDPSNGALGDGDDFVTGKLRSTFGTIKVAGIADGASLFAAGKFTSVKVGGTKVDPAGDPRFLLASTAPDEDPPVITARLRTDTGDDGDSITSDPTIVGRVTDLGQVATFRVGIDGDALEDFVSVRGMVEPDGTFELSRAKLEQINGGPLSVGAHTINFLAKDDVGNTATIYTVAFVFAP